jgi:Polyketide cyclase / dehydrase and lipid transport
MILYSITKSVSIDAPPARVFEFLANAANWPKWAIVNVKSVKPAEGEWWDMETPAGRAKLRIRPNAGLGTLDHDFNAPDASWTVPARVVPNGSGSEFMITFFQPPSFTKEFFEEQAAQVDKELAQLKNLMEST